MSLARTSPEALDHIEATGGYELPAVQILPTAVLPKSEFPIVAEQIVERFRDITDNLTAFVLVKQAAEILKEAEGQLLDFALTSIQGNKQNVLSAEVSTRALTDYTYNDAELAEWEAEVEKFKKLIADRKSALRKANVVNGLGEVCSATKTRDGQTLMVKFK